MAVSIDRRFAKAVKPWLNSTTCWFVLSLAIAFLYRLPALLAAFSGDYVVQDDARQHVFWMQRLIDPSLFSHDFLADYFQSVAPWGYTTLYHAGIVVGIDPWTLNKCLPVLIAVVTTAFAFGVVWELTRMPVAAFAAALFLNQSLVVRDDIVSGTPVAFIYPLFCGFLYFLLRRSWLPTVLTIVLMGLFYPQGVLVIGGILVLMAIGHLRWCRNRLKFVGKAVDLQVIVSGLLAAFWVLLPYALRDSAYGPVLTLAEARQMFTLSPQGWSNFFSDSPVEFWLFGQRTGMLPSRWATLDLKIQPQIWLTLAIPFLVMFPGRSRLAQAISPRIWVLLQVLIASVGCYFLAHLLLFKLHLPNRYTEHSFRVIAALGSGIAIALIIDRCRHMQFRKIAQTVGLILLVSLTIVPILEIGWVDAREVDVAFDDSHGNYYVGQFPAVYEYLKNQPKTTVVASLDREINNIPSFTNRTIFVGGKGYALPYHLGYFEAVKQRSVDLIEAQYSLDADAVKGFLQDNQIDLWMVRPEMFTSKWVTTSEWLREYAADLDSTAIAAAVENTTILEQHMDLCQAADMPPFVLIDANCLRTQL